MATKREKQELIDTLKFTPTPVRIQLYGYGGECYIGSVSREQYEFFKSKKIDIDQYTHSWDDEGMWDDVPADMRPFDPGSPYDCDDLFHASGATMDESSWITVEEVDSGQELFKSNLDIPNLENQGVQVTLGEDCDNSDWPDGRVVFWGGQGEKGCFFDGEIVLRAPFDPTKLRIYYGNGDDWLLTGGVEYDGEEVEGNDGYSTTGKWAEGKFWIKGNEEVYEGVERSEDGEDEDDDSDPSAEMDKIQIPVLEGEEIWAQEMIDSDTIDTEPDLWEGIPLSPWHPGSQNPVREGEYDVILGTWPFPQRAHWDGVLWKQGDQPVIVNTWRGLSQPAH
jgi:hypothetical protein